MCIYIYIYIYIHVLGYQWMHQHILSTWVHGDASPHTQVLGCIMGMNPHMPKYLGIPIYPSTCGYVDASPCTQVLGCMGMQPYSQVNGYKGVHPHIPSVTLARCCSASLSAYLFMHANLRALFGALGISDPVPHLALAKPMYLFVECWGNFASNS
jgi:hypothetical protein